MNQHYFFFGCCTKNTFNQLGWESKKLGASCEEPKKGFEAKKFKVWILWSEIKERDEHLYDFFRKTAQKPQSLD